MVFDWWTAVTYAVLTFFTTVFGGAVAAFAFSSTYVKRRVVLEYEAKQEQTFQSGEGDSLEGDGIHLRGRSPKRSVEGIKTPGGGSSPGGFTAYFSPTKTQSRDAEKEVIETATTSIQTESLTVDVSTQLVGPGSHSFEVQTPAEWLSNVNSSTQTASWLSTKTIETQTPLEVSPAAIAVGTQTEDIVIIRLCNYCEKPKHLEKDCLKKKADLARQNGSGGGGYSRNRPSGAAPAGAFPPCTGCKKTNHTPDRCFWRKDKTNNPGGASQPPGSGGAEQAVRAGASQVIAPGVPAGDLGAVLAAVIAKKAGINIGCSAIQYKEEPEPTQLVGAAAKRQAPWMPDSGSNLWATNAKPDVELVAPVVPMAGECPVLGLDGVATLGEATTVAVPEIEGDRDAIVSRKGPNMCPRGRLIYEDDYYVEKWNKRDGLIFRRPDGSLVNTYMKDMCPMVGHADDDDDLIDDNHALAEAACNMGDFSKECIEDIVGEVSDFIEDLSEDLEGLICHACIAPEDPTEVFIAAAADGEQEESAPTSLQPTRRRHNPIPVIGTKDKQVPLDHLLTHRFKHPFCQACESGKMRRTPGFRVPVAHPQPDPEGSKVKEVPGQGEEELPSVKAEQQDDVEEEDEGEIPELIPDVMEYSPEDLLEGWMDHKLDGALDEVDNDVDMLLAGFEQAIQSFVDEDMTDEKVKAEEEPTDVAIARRAAKFFLRKMYLDLVEPTCESWEGHTGVSVARDCDANWPELWTIPDKAPSTVLRGWVEKFPGHVRNGRAPHEVYCDNGGEFKAEFADHVVDSGGVITNTLELGPKTNATEERFHDTLTRCCRAKMKQAGSPVRFWSSCLRRLKHSMQRTKDGWEDGLAPYQRRYHVMSKSPLVPFGCRIIFYDDNAAKYQAHSKEGIMMEYAILGGFQVLDRVEYVQTRGVVRMLTTRHVKIHPREFPFWEIIAEHAFHDQWHLTLRALGDEDLDYRVDYMGRVKCANPDCMGFITDEPITCAVCIAKGRHGKGRPGFGCLRSRCQCKEKKLKENKDVVNVTTISTTTAKPDSPRPRWRVFGRQPASTVEVSPRDRPANRPRSTSPRAVSPRAEVEVTGEGGVQDAAAVEPAQPVVEAQPASPEVSVVPPLLAVAKNERKPERAYFDERTDEQKVADAKQSAKQISKLFLTDYEAFEECQRDLKFAIGAVTRIIDPKPQEAKSAIFEKSVEKERQNLRSKHALDFDGLREKHEIALENPKAEFVDGRMLTVQRNAEIESADMDLKSRFIAQGHNQRDIHNQKVQEDVIQTVPATMTDEKVGVMHANFFDNGIAAQADVDGAYITTLLGGVFKYLIIPMVLFPLFDVRIWKMTKPVCRMLRALYGFKRAGADWGEKVKQILKAAGWSYVLDVAQSVFLKWPILLILYTDDLLLSGPKDIVLREYDVLDKLLGFSKKVKQRELTMFVGLSYRPLRVDAEGTKYFKLHQSEYCRVICRDYMEYKSIVNMKPVSTPVEERDEKLVDSDEPGEDAPVARKYTGSFLFLVRGTRGEGAYALSRLGRAVSKWLRRHDRALYKLVQYFWSTSEMGLIGYVNPGDMENFEQKSWSDADLGGSLDTTRSTAGYATWVTGSRTMMPLDPTARLMDFTGISTPEAELVASAMCTVRSALPINSLLSEIYGRMIPLHLGIDNTTGRLDILQGYSKGMKHLKRHHRLSIGLYGETVARPGIEVDILGSGENTTDLFTKALGPILFVRHRRGFGSGLDENDSDRPPVGWRTVHRDARRRLLEVAQNVTCSFTKWCLFFACTHRGDSLLPAE